MFRIARTGLAGAAALVLSAISAANSLAGELKVVATFSILGDLVHEVGGEHVQVTTLVGPNGDAHVFEPSPVDARHTAGAALVFVNGLGLEGWLDRLIDASGYKGTVVVASHGVTPIKISDERAAGMPVEEEEAAPGAEESADHARGVDPHAWQSIGNAEIYVTNIATALCAADAVDCADFQANAASYSAALKQLDRSIRQGFASVPADKRRIITSHDAFGYFAKAYGVEMLAPEGVSTEAEASAADVAKLIRQIRDQGIAAIFVENASDPRLIEQIANETGVAIGGELYSDALSPPDGPAATYLAMMRHNSQALLNAMQGS